MSYITDSTHEIATEVAAARHRAHDKHGEKSIEAILSSDPRWLSILVEEVGEASHELTYDATGSLRAELIDVITVATAWVAAIDRAKTRDEAPEPNAEHRGRNGHVWPCPLFYVGNWSSEGFPQASCVNAGTCADERAALLRDLYTLRGWGGGDAARRVEIIDRAMAALLSTEPQGEPFDSRGIIARALMGEARMDSIGAWNLADDIVAALRAAGVHSTGQHAPGISTVEDCPICTPGGVR